ncbi:MAG: hypothetical protein ACREEP_01875 [Dongiaceae bacterium]
MDKASIDKKRHYQDWIFSAINDNPHLFAASRPISIVAETTKGRRIGVQTPPPRPPHRASTGVELQWHNPIKVLPAAARHTLLRLTPENQEAYEHDPRFQNFDEFGRRYATLGAGPDSLSGLAAGEAMPASFPDQERDVAPHAQGIAIDPPAGMSADDYINLLLKLDRAYNDDLSYEIHPGEVVLSQGRLGPPVHRGWTYNSNSYIAGLLAASGVVAPDPPVSAPGYNQRVPLRYFGK